ncbi:tRNA lysidine(34) synthetase TilS [Primorskyibacter sp. 2E233]|uniref:tRNA lysidine(34) synthetase TilS n=1 Tax=Primorskyibacter sp. 2E233 TaxID=3413431 RepID=UPI003BF0B4C1
MSLDQRFAEAMGQLLGPDFPTDIALAVSGGGDSMAMLTLAHNWAHRWGVRIWVVTVDHGLRHESAEEAAVVARECAALGHPHATLRWHWDGQGNKLDAARRARLDLIDRWRGDIGHVLMAHTRDDLAETFLMRLRRGSGVEGLSAMRAKRRVAVGQRPAIADEDCTGARPPSTGARQPGFSVLRPCLDMSRDALRHYLRVLKGTWVDDPSNDDPSYDRARIRQLLTVLEGEGMDKDSLAATARRLRDERQALMMRAAQVWQEIGQDHPDGSLSFAPDWHGQVETATQRRLLSAALQYVSAADYGPRADALEALRDRLVSGGTGTLHGCEAAIVKGRLTIFREYAAVQAKISEAGKDTLWDNKWLVSLPGSKGLTIRALGEDGWRQVRDKPQGAPAHRVGLALPAVWEGDDLIVCDLLGVGPGGTTAFSPQGQSGFDFKAFLLSH